MNLVTFKQGRCFWGGCYPNAHYARSETKSKSDLETAGNNIVSGKTSFKPSAKLFNVSILVSPCLLRGLYFFFVVDTNDRFSFPRWQNSLRLKFLSLIFLGWMFLWFGSHWLAVLVQEGLVTHFWLLLQFCTKQLQHGYKTGPC